MRLASTLIRLAMVALATNVPTHASIAQGPDLGGEMKHIEVRLVGTVLHAEVDPFVGTPVLRDTGVTYTGGASILNGTYFNGQYGWTVGGFWTPPTGAFVYLEQIDGTPGLSVYAQGTYAPIFSTSGSSARVRWNGAMVHNWYSTTTAGPHEATYVVYFGDASGTPVSGYTPATVTLAFDSELVGACLADFDGNGEVDVLDFLEFIDAFSTCESAPGPCPSADVNSDVNGDTIVDILDFLDFIDAFGQGTCP